ncbi:MAG: hypothetical protein LBK82_08275 [Planctomycetaceae bacterium]|nr:hypothetical protein [Planctomycetaceae bacterium]
MESITDQPARPFSEGIALHFSPCASNNRGGRPFAERSRRRTRRQESD